MTGGLLIVGAYVLGSIPFGLLIGLARGVDVRQHGSRNIGATNVGRVVGRTWGFLCLGLDILKGFAPTLAASLLLPQMYGAAQSGALVAPLVPGSASPSRLAIHADPAQQFVLLGVALAAVLGHVFPIYLRFRGGKGVATTIGVALGIWPYFTIAMAAAIIAYAAVRFGTGLVSVGSLTIAVVFPAAFFGYTRIAKLSLAECWPLQTVAILLGLVIIVRHRENIGRLLARREIGVRAADEKER